VSEAGLICKFVRCRNAFHKDMANMGFGVTEIIINEPLQDLSAYRGRLLHYKRG
jgi:hypothetical protein